MSNHPKYGNIVKATADRLVKDHENKQNIDEREEQRWSHAIQGRVNALNVNRLMKAAREREQFERNAWVQSRGKFGHDDKFHFPNLSMRENEGMLRYAAMNILGNSAQEDPMEILVDKVVVLCAILSNPNASSHLDIGLIMRAIDDVFSKYHSDSAYEMLYRLTRIESRLIALNRQFKGRAAAAAAAMVAAAAAVHVGPSSIDDSMAANQSSRSIMDEVDGGFYKKNYRRSIKTKKSRKLRSRR